MSQLPSGLAETLADEENVARFIMSSSWVAASTGRVKHPAFLPAPDNDTSVFRSTGITRDQLWAIGDNEIEGRRYHGAAEVLVGTVRQCGLDALAQEPPLRHANLRGWFCSPDPELQKARRKSIALVIAEEAGFIGHDAA